MALFQKGQPKIGGRRKGTRDKLSTAFLEALAEDFVEHGSETIRIARIEHPETYLKVVASLLPKEFELTNSRLAEFSDDELDAFIELAKSQLGSIAANAKGREEPSLN